MARLGLSWRVPPVVPHIPVLRTLLLSQQREEDRHLPPGPYPALQELSLRWPGLRYARSYAGSALGLFLAVALPLPLPEPTEAVQGRAQIS